ncbi:hypothetical protein REPUB_Repub04eG0031600 [Reevesia pubescens]
MATSSYHARSNSLPSKQHPITSQIDENLNRLKASQLASTSSSMGQKLNGLQDLHEYVDMLLQLPLTQQALAQEQQRKWVEELLDGSLMLLDVCSTARDALLQTKECTQELQSILRRRQGVEGLATEVRKYLTSRKAVKKAICKALKNLKHMQNKLSTSSSNKDGSEAESKPSHWSLVFKLMHQKKAICEEEEQNEIVKTEATLHSFIKSENMKHVENVQNELQNLELCIKDLEGLESLFRRLIKARVTVLNILHC